MTGADPRPAGAPRGQVHADGPVDRPQGHDRPAIVLRPRTLAALLLASLAGLVAFGWPLVLSPGSGLEHSTDAPLVLSVVLAAVVVVVAMALGEGGIDVKAVAVLGLLSAVGAVLRPLSAGTAGVELVFVVVVLGGRVFGPVFGFALGSTTIFASALLTGGVGPWLPFQMLATAWVGLGAGLLPRGVRGRREVLLVAAYGAVAGLAFGVLMNLSFWPFQLGSGTALSFVPGDAVTENLRRFLLFTAATSLGWDVGRAVTTAVGLAVLGRPGLLALRRASARAAFAPAVTPDHRASGARVVAATVSPAPPATPSSRAPGH